MKFVKFFIPHYSTISTMFYDKDKDRINSYFIQFSLKDMWRKPHREERFNNGSYIYGWLFFYFGNIISGGEVK